MQHLTYVVFINLAHYYGKRPCQPCVLPVGQLAVLLVASLILRPMIRMHMYKIRNWHLMQWSAATECCECFYWPGWIWSMKILSCRAPRCINKYQFHAKMTMFSSFDNAVEHTTKRALVLPNNFVFSCPSAWNLGKCMSLADHKCTQREMWDA